MSSFFYAINIGTLATWLSVGSFGTVGIVIPAAQEILHAAKTIDPYKDLESTVFAGSFTEDSELPSQETDTGTTGVAEETDVPFAEQETLPTPPEMPNVAEITPLPEIPDMPPPTAKPADNPAPAPTKPRPVPRPNNKTPTRSNKPTSATGGSSNSRADAMGKAGNGGQNGGSGMSDAKRLSGGYRPRPPYPAEARSKGHTGTVIVAFVVDESGQVISAYAQRSSGWPDLDQSAVSTLRRWKFAPGKRLQQTIPIKFELK